MRSTKDVDVVPSPDAANLKRLAGVLRTSLGRFDVMQWIGDDALWEKLAAAAVSAGIGNLPVRVVGYEDLVALKQRAGRPEDLADLLRLSQARGEAP